MALGSTTTIKIPIEAELQNTQKIVVELRNVLSKMNPDTKGFKEINSLLDTAEKKLETIQQRSTHGVINTRELNSVQKEFTNALFSIEKAAGRVQNLRFDNLSLSDNQKKQFEDIKNKIEAVRQSYADLEHTKLSELAQSSQQLEQSLQKVGVNIDADSIETSLNKVSTAIANVKKEIEDLQSKQNAQLVKVQVRNDQIAELEKLKDIFSSSASERAQNHSDFFTVNGNFKAGQKNVLIERLAQLGLDDVSVSRLKSLSASRISEVAEAVNKVLDSKIKAKNREKSTAETNIREYATRIADAQLRGQELENLRSGISNLRLDPELQNSLVQTIDRVAQLEQEIEQLKAKLLEQSGASNTAANALNGASQAASSAAGKFGQVADDLNDTAIAARNMESIKMAVTNFLGFNQVLNIVRNSIRNAINHIKELDTTMNGIAIVTNMTTADLWKQVDAYSSMAQKFGVTIQGAYEVSKIYYQAGYDTNEVLTLTNETLKLSKISGLDYATTTDYMMTAMRGFKLEMEDASRVVDVYSNLAANTAVSQQELAEAMTRTASSMESVGATFEETSAMIATMVAVTRESANNIGSAMKSIASRYGELTKDPQKLFDAEGEAMSFNKVDTALKSVGITLQTTDHQFRDFTDVIIELAKKWDALDSAQQRYIATQFAGNRQQSRFLALVSNIDLLQENIANAENSEDVGTLQYLKALDSLESKINQVQVAYQQFYTTIGIENAWKTFLDGARNTIDTLNRLPKLFGKVPVLAIAMIGNLINVIRAALRIGFKMIISDWQTAQKELSSHSKDSGTEIGEGLIAHIIKSIREGKQRVVQETKDVVNEAKTEATNAAKDNANTPKASEAEKSVGIFSKLGQSNGLTKTFSVLSGILSVMSLIIPTASETGKVASGAIMGVAGALKVLGAASAANPVLAVISGIAMIASGIATAIESGEEKLERLNAEAEELNNKAKEAKANYNTLQRSIDKVEELKQKRYESAEAAEEYQTAVNELAEAFPEMIQGFDEAGNIVVDITNKEELLAKAREKTAKATYEAAKSELKATEEKKQQAKENANESIGTNESYVKFSENNLHDFFWGLLGEDSETQLKFLAKHINWDEYGKGYSENAYNYHDRNEMLGIYLRQGGAISDLLQEKNVTFSGLEGTIDDFKNIFQLLDLIDITSDIGQNLYTQAKKLYDKAKKDNPEIEQKFGEVFKSVGEAIDEYNSYAKLSTSEIKTIVSAWQNLNKEFSYIANDSGFASIITENIAKELEAENITDPEEIEKYLNGSEWQENIEVIESYWTSLAMKDKDRAARLKEMLANPEKYTAEDILKEFDFDEEIRDLISNAYEERLNNVEANLNKTIRGDSETGVKGLVGNLSPELSAPLELFVNSFGEAVGQISYEEAQILGNAAREYTEMAQNGFATQGENLLKGVEHLFNAVKDNPLVESYVNSLIKSNSLFTKEGIDEIIGGIESNDDITEETKENLIKTLLFMRSNIIDNYALSVQAAISELEDGWENAGKEMAKLRSGASLKEVNAVIENAKALGIEISREDFTGPANKLILAEGKFYEYFYASQKKLNTRANEMAENVRRLKEVNEFNLEDNKEIVGNAFGEDYYKKLQDNWNQDEFEQKVKEYAQDVSDYQLMLQQTQEQMLRDINWAIGNYSDLFKNGFDESKLRGAAAQGGRNLSRTQISEREAVKKINDVYGKLISDVLSKGFANIDLTNYQGLFDNGIGIELKGSYQDFVRQYVDLTGKTAEEINSIMVQSIEKDNQAVTTLVSSIKNMSSASVSQIGQIANILSDNLGLLVDPNAIIRSVKQNKDGTYDVSNYIVNFLIPQLFKGEVPEAVQEALDDMLTSAAEAAIKGLQDVNNIISKGFSNFAEIEKFGNNLKQVNFGIGDWVYTNNKYTLTASGIAKSFKNYWTELVKNLKLQHKSEKEIELILKNETDTILNSLESQVNIQKYLSSERTNTDRKELEEAYNNWRMAVIATGKSITYQFEEFIKRIEDGGEEAVAIAQAMAKDTNKDLSAKDIEAIYRASVSKLENSIEQISYGIGAIVDKTTAEIIGLDNVDQIANTSQYVITSTINLAEAYKALYDKFEQNNQTTLAQLNSIKALQLENESDKLAVEFLGDAAKMTWTRLAEVFSQAGIKLTDKLVEDLKNQNVIKELGGGKLRITKPEQLLAAMGINGDSEEYTSALKTLNDALIEANDKVSRNIMEELQKAAAAKPGEQVNLTQLYKELSITSQHYLVGLAQEFGAKLDSGILTISNNTNIVGLVENIIAYAKQKELLLEDQMAQLADTLSDTLNSYIDMLKNGIAGTLSNVNANTLQSYATSLDLGKLDFTQTANGLKISADSAIKLYSAIKETDKLKAQLVFDDLSASIQKSQDGLENLSNTLRTIKKLEEELGKTPNNKAVADRLALYKEIAAQQAADPEQYNFMNRSLPNGMKGVENYWNSAGAAFNAMNEAGQTGYMEIQDFYNIVNEMTNLAALSGESIEFMGQTIDGDVRTSAKLIEQAMSALTNIDGEGVKLSLAELGANLFTGAEDMQNGFDKGIKAMASAQIKMLDAMIQMLEGIVALQELGEIDADGNGIDFSELFIGDKETGQVDGFQKKAQETAQSVLKAAEANEDLEKALDTFKLGELSLREVLNAIGYGKWEDISAKITPEQLLSALNIFKDIDFDSVDFVTIQQVIQEAFNKIFPEQALLNDPEVKGRIDSYIRETFGQIDDDTNKLEKALNTAREKRNVQQQMMVELAYGNITYDEGTRTFTGANGTNYGSDEAKALIQNILENAGYGGKEINYDYSGKNHQASSGVVKINYKDFKVDVEAGINGEIKYSSGNGWYKTLDEAIINSKEFEQFTQDQNISSDNPEALTQYKYAVGIEVSPVVRFNPNKDVNKETINKAIQAIQDYMSGSEVSLSDAVTAAKAAGIQFNSETEVTMPQLQNALDKLLAFEEQQNQSETIGHLTSAQEAVKENTTAIERAITALNNFTDHMGDLNKQGGGNPPVAEAPDAKGAIEKKGAEAAAAVLENVKTDVTALGDVKANAAAELEAAREAKIAADAEAAEEATRLAAAREEAARIANEVTQQILQEAQTALDGIKDEAAASVDELLNAQDQAKKAQENAEKAANEATQLRQQAEEALAQAKLDSQKLSGEMSAAAQSALDQATAAAESAKKSEEAAIESAKKAGENVGKVNEAIEEAIQKLNEKLEECETKLAQTAEELETAKEGLKTGSTDKNTIKEIWDRALALMGERVEAARAQGELGRSLGPQSSSDAGNVVQPTPRPPQEDNIVEKQEEVIETQKNAAEFQIDAAQAQLEALKSLLAQITNSDIYQNAQKKLINPAMATVEGFTDEENAVANLYNVIVGQIKNLEKEIEEYKEANKEVTETVNENSEAAEKNSSKQKVSSESANSAGNSQENLANAQDDTANSANKGASAQVNLTSATNTLSNASVTASGDVNGLGNSIQELSDAASAAATTIAAAAKAAGEAADQAYQAAQSAQSTTDGVSGGARNDAAQQTHTVNAKGNVALASGRSTLMGELGPELYVTNGHYYVAGQNGAEFVDLPSDAIVFNHLQTERLLKNGSAGRGKAVTNDRKATSFATGNVSGPAMASAQTVLAQLKQIRAMWDAMLNASVSDLGSKAGLGKKAGGGGSKDKGQTVKLDSGYIRDLERWYNLLRQIDRLEQDINYEEKLRSKLQADTVANGELIYESQRRTYEMLQRELDDRVELASLKKGYYEQRMAEIQAGPWGQLFYFNEEGVPQMKNLQFLADVFASSEEGGAVHNAREQYAMLQQAGFGSLLQYKEDGSVIEWTDDEGKPREEAYKEAVEAFSAKLDAQTEEVNSLREDYIEEMGNILDLQTKQNEILTQIRENTIAVEQEVLKAIEDFREREIDELQKQRDALSDSADKFIDGLTDSLNKEREMYNSQQEDTELLQMRRQLAILQRSGGSASQIRSLQEQIRQREQEAYFKEQENQINAIKEASNLQLERLDAQISLMQETLEYQKAHGLLWEQVHEIMQGTHEEITQFVTGNNSEWWAKSATQAQNDLVELDNKIGQWVAHRDDISALGETMKNAINNGIAAITSVVAQVSAPQQYTVSGTGSYTIPSGSSGSGGSSGSSGNSGKKNSSSSSKKTSNNSAKSWHISASPSLSFATQSAAQEYQKKQTNLAWNSYHSNEDDKELYDEYRKWSTAHISQYSRGGLIDYTGPAWVDGTKKKPEGILNAEQLDMLRNSVLTRKNPIAALLADYGNTVSDTANANTYNSIDRGGDTVIENAQVVMNVSKMSNDYDAKRAGKTALEEMLRISRKTKPTSVSRR